MIDCPRDTSRAAFRIVYRVYRIVARENRLAWRDRMLYGSSYILTGPMAHDRYQHIPVDKIRILPGGNASLAT